VLTGLTRLILAELYSREALSQAKRIANPGCFATNSQLLLAPLLPFIASPPTISAISGYSGAGTKSGSLPKVTPEDLHHAVKPYALTDHIHEREAGFHLSSLLPQGAPVGSQLDVAFMPHVAPWFQGIISTVSIPLSQTMRASEVRELFQEAYDKESLVKVVPEIPQIHDIAGKHGVRLGGFQVHSSGKRVVAVVGGVLPWLGSDVYGG